MRCMICDRGLPDSFFEELARSEAFKGGRFACPQCGAEHVRRQVGQLPSGAPLYSLRLWGHLTSMKRRPLETLAAAGAERRKAPRGKRWR